MSAIQPTGVNPYAQQSSKPVNMKADTASEAQPVPSALTVEKSSVTLSDEGKALLAALKEIDVESKKAEKDESVSKSVESFAHGALGMDHPDEIEEIEDDSYSAGQYLSAALTVGGILLAVV